MEITIITNIVYNYYSSIILIAIITTLLRLKSHKNLPPGPWGLPIVGYLPFLKQPPHVGITELGKKYGNVMSFYLGSVLVIVLSDYNTIKEAFVKQGNIFSGKPNANAFRLNKTDKGLMVAEGETASQHRRFILSSFRDFGMGKTTLEPQLMEEIKCFLAELRKENEKPIDLKPFLHSSMSNVIAMLEFGKRFDYSDEEFIQLRNLIINNAKFNGATSIRVFLPWIKYIPFTDNLTGFHKTRSAVKLIIDFFRNKLEQNEKKYIEGSRTHYIDAYLTKRNSVIQKTGSEGYFGKEDLIGNLRALFGAGTETSTGIILWSVLYLLKFPNIGKKVLQEINDVIGYSRDPAFSDKINMPYTEAFMLEVLRHSSLVSFSLVHSNMEEATLCGYTIPKHCYVIGNLLALHQDKNLWRNPEEFNPKRFINDQGKVEKPEHFIPFSIGKRNCIGESLANMNHFLYFTTFLQNFEIKIPDGETVSIEPIFAIGLVPKPFKICVVAR